ncbi:MAG: hydrogenase maturation protease [Candidatus Lokiarchaeota archaeon]|nr:hydrogenase maturation protease [Candidatus Lokiarchaeota archaeon]
MPIGTSIPRFRWKCDTANKEGNELAVTVTKPIQEQKTIIYGWGNPIFGDDAAGIQAARQLNECNLPSTVEVAWSSSSPFSVAERFLGYDRAVLIDAFVGTDRESGEIIRFTGLADQKPLSMLTPHTASILDVLKIYRELYPLRFPSRVIVYGLCINNPEMTNEITYELETGINNLLNLIQCELTGESA